MKHRILSLIAILFSIVASAQKAPLETLDLQPDGNYYQRNHQTPFGGVAFEDFPNGKRKSRAEFKNGKLNGKVTTWHEKTGEKASLVHYKSGVLTGMETHWYDTGVKKLEISYDADGLATGVCKEYYPDGTLKSEGEYVKDLEEGLHKWYFQDGQTDQTIQYEGGLANGKVFHYFKGGKKKMEGDYQAGRPHGKVVHFHENGQKKRLTNYQEGKEQGKDYLWSKKGLLLEERNYEAGEETAFNNYRSGAIKTKKGYLQIFNEKESFFTIHVMHDEWVRPRSSREITYVVDDFVLQLFNTPISGFTNETGLSDADILRKHLEAEKAFISKSTGKDIAPQVRTRRHKGGEYLHWSFKSPTLAEVAYPSELTVEEEHYFTFVCGKQVLVLYVPKTKGNDAAKIVPAIQRMADSITLEAARIDLNERRQQIRVNNGLPALRANETFKDYK